MTRLAHWREQISVLAELHVAALVGAAVGLLSDFIGTDGTAKILIGLAVAVVVRQVGDLAGASTRATCMRGIAANARATLDRRLKLGLAERFDVGQSLTLREIVDVAAVPGALEQELRAGTAADGFSRQVWTLRASLQTELGPCRGDVRRHVRQRLDAFLGALGELATAAADLVTIDAYTDQAAEKTENARQYERTRSAIRAAVQLGDELDLYCDPKTARAEAAGRSSAIAKEQSVERDALKVLIANGREIVGAFTRAAPAAGDAEPTDKLIQRIRPALDLGLHVAAAPYQAAAAEARAAHHHVVYEDLFDALNALNEPGTNTDEARAKADALLQRLPEDLAKLEALAQPSS